MTLVKINCCNTYYGETLINLDNVTTVLKNEAYDNRTSAKYGLLINNTQLLFNSESRRDECFDEIVNAMKNYSFIENE